MTAEEIRKIQLGRTDSAHMEFICVMLQEIAVQLAEMNERESDLAKDARLNAKLLRMRDR